MRIDRHLLREVAYPFTLVTVLVVALVFLFQARRLANAALGLALTPGDAFTIFLAALPPFLVLAIPIAFLLSILIAFGRLAEDLEVTALRAAGATPWQIARAPVGLGFLVSLGCLPISIFGEPAGLTMLHARLVDVGLRNLSNAVLPGTFNEDFRGSAVYAQQRSPDGVLKDVLLFDERDPARAVLMTAERGTITTEANKSVQFVLEDGEMHLGATSDPERYDRLVFERAELTLDADEEINQRTRFVSILGRMSMTEMRSIFEGGDPTSRYVRRVEQTYWRRFALPSMALIFSIIGAAIALSGSKRSRTRNAILGIGAVISYYVLTRVADVLVLKHGMSAFWAAWGPNLLFLIPGIFWLARSGRAHS